MRKHYEKHKKITHLNSNVIFCLYYNKILHLNLNVTTRLCITYKYIDEIVIEFFY